MTFFYKIFAFCILLGLQTNLWSQQIDFNAENIAWAQKRLSKMSLREKIGQLFMMDVSPKIDHAKDKKILAEKIKKLKLGGIIVMKGDYSIAADWIREFQKVAPTPLMVSIDGEWGINMRIQNTTKFPYQLTLGALADDKLIYDMGSAIARDCKRLGIHVNFAPVVDVNTNPKNPVINFRSFGENKSLVAQKGLQYAKGMQDQGVMACLKHFPGHGDTDKDSHKDLPSIHKTREEIFDLELYPFKELIQKNIWSVMVGHLNVPALDPTGIPTSLSNAVITGVLKRDFKFQGLIFSDALNMKGVSANATPGQMELDAYLAGNDILLYSENIEKGMSRIEDHVKSNASAKQELDERILKILLFKHKLGSHILPEVNYSPDEHENEKLSQDLYDKALTLLSDDHIGLEQWMDGKKKTLYITLNETNSIIRKDLEKHTQFTFFNLHKNSNAEAYENAIRSMRDYDQVIIAYHDLSQYENKNYGLNASQIDFIQNASAKDQVLHIWLGNPYALKYFQSANHILLSYEENLKTQKAISNAFIEKKVLNGKIPVSIGKFKQGQGYVAIEKTNVHVPVEEMDYSNLDRASALIQIESLANEIMTNGVAPGFQMVVLHEGKEIYNKCHGRHTYGMEAKLVEPTDFYDLASLTKILCTTLATMKLYEEGKIDLDRFVKDYIPLDDSSSIHYTTIRQLLTHDAGLTPFIPFYKRFQDENYYLYFDTKRSDEFPYQVADNLYVRKDYKDSMWHEMIHTKLGVVGKYKYSDLSMYTLQRIIENLVDMPLDQYIQKNFYKKMGVSLTYNPSFKLPKSRIIPTEFDASFRKQQVHGYVHDQGACLYGGVSGHAGLFGTASDVAKVMQMLLNGGTWGKHRLLNASTITQFTEQQRLGSRRGLGFDKPDTENPAMSPASKDCSFASYGHTGFTGTCAWVDPFQQLVFVFLSNRVYPSTDNKKLANGKYREKMMSLFYQYIRSK